MGASTLLVTIALGERHSTRWHRYCKPGWEVYAEIAFPLRHPESVRCDMEADAFSEDVLFSGHMRRMFERAREAALRARSGRGRPDRETVSP